MYLVRGADRSDAIAGELPPVGLAARILVGIGEGLGKLRTLLSNIRVFREDS
jgi:hypothetical protein